MFSKGKSLGGYYQFTLPNRRRFFPNQKAKNPSQASEGMICAEDEFDLGRSHAGIMVWIRPTQWHRLRVDPDRGWIIFWGNRIDSQIVQMLRVI
jgi:hypothetical protein